MLRSAPLDPRQVTRALETIERNTWMQAQLIDDLLDVSRIIAGKLRLEKRATNLVTIIEAAVESLRRDAEAKQLAVDVRLDRAADLVFGDPVRLQQIMVNLLGNAVKFTPDGGRITLRLERVEASARIVVTDTGCGIDPDALPHIFERFRQEDSTIARGHTGLGLGLAIVRHLVELHGGTITARSDGRGRGATFTVDLPILAVKLPAVDAAGAPEAPTLEVVAGEPASPDSTRRLEGVQALVVDDHPDARELVAMVLKQFGAEVETAGSATDALAALESTRFDVLVSDLGMPLADGFELIRRLRASERAHGRRVLPAIALTAYTAPEDRERALAAGFNAHAAKPIDPAELIEIVAKIARRIAAA
jgi:CheY-like chemotaxis protein/two-component sensor histidine kinase